MLLITCDFCGKKFPRIEYKIRKAKRHFCSRQCRFHYVRAQMQVSKCLNCQVEFLNKGRRMRFCSRKCASRYYGSLKKSWVTSVEEEIMELYLQGKHSIRAIAKMFGRKPETIFAYFRKKGIKLRDREEALRLGKHALWFDPFYRKRMTEKYIDNLHLSLRPTTLEKKLIILIEQEGLPFDYVGDKRSFSIGGKYPDFIHTHKKIVVEIFGSYWHSPLLNSRVEGAATFEQRQKHFEKYGYKCLIVWEEELKNEKKLLEKLSSFSGFASKP